MAYCPQCSSEIEATAEKCRECGALFGPNSAWKPTEQPPDKPADQPAAAEAAAGPRGIGGWLILPMLGLIFTPFRMGYQFVTDLLPVLNATTWQALTSPSSPNYHPLWAPLIGFEVVANIAVFAFGLWVLIQFFSKSKSTPRLYIIWMASLAIMQIVDVALANQIPAVAAQPDAQSMKDVGRALLAAAIWIPYFLVSKRVRNTFVN